MKLSSCSSIVFVLIWTAELCVLCFAQEDTIFRPESIPPEIGLRMEYFLTVEQYDSCMTDLAITVEKKKVWDQSSFLAFVKRRTDGAIDQNVLDSSILELVYIYWFVICTAVGPDLCLYVSSVTSAQVTEFYFDNGEPLTEEICERMQYYLDQQQDRNRMPSVSPSELPTKSIQLQISESPSTSSPTGMPTKIRIVDEDQEPTFQPSTKSLSPSSSPSLAPTFLSVTEYLTFQIYYNTTDTTTTTTNATTSTTCLQNLIQEYITMELEQIFACPYDDIEHNNMDIDSPTWWCALDVIQISLLEFFPFECLKEPPPPPPSIVSSHNWKPMCALVSLSLTLQRTRRITTIMRSMNQDHHLPILRNILSDEVTFIINQDAFQSAILSDVCESD